MRYTHLWARVPAPRISNGLGLIHIAINTDGEWYRQEMG